MPQDEIEINVIQGYRLGGGIVIGCSFLLIGIFASVAKTSIVPAIFAPLMTMLIGLVMCLSVSKIRFSPNAQQAEIEDGVWPIVKRRTENLSGEKRFVMRPYSRKGAGRIVVNLEMADGRKFPILRNVSSYSFDAFAEALPAIGAPLVLAGPMDITPDWVKERIRRFGIERA